MKSKEGFRKLVTYLVFVVIAALFWFFLALNDNIQDDFQVKVEIANVPDSVTFIELPPDKVHVTVRGKGTSLWQRVVAGHPKMDLNFRDYADDGVFRVGRNEVNAELKDVFGQSATILSASIDSLSLTYTTLPGKRIPVMVNSDLTAAAGKVISGKVSVEPKSVLAFGLRENLDSLIRVSTNLVTRHNLEESCEIKVKLDPLKGIRLQPDVVTLKIKVEPLVRKESNVDIKIVNVPEGYDLLLFPSNVNVEYYVPMSDFNRTDNLPEVSVDFMDLERGSRKLPLSLSRISGNMQNVMVLSDSVEYTLVKN